MTDIPEPDFRPIRGRGDLSDDLPGDLLADLFDIALPFAGIVLAFLALGALAIF